jgi:hypothetical protein
MSNAQVTQVAVEDAVSSTPNAQVTQAAVESAVQSTAKAQVSQVALEIVNVNKGTQMFVFVNG